MEQDLRKKVQDAVKEYFDKAVKPRDLSEYIPVSGKVLDAEDLSNLVDAALDMWLTAGRFNDAFESRFAEYLGVKHVVTVNSGSSANLLALSALTSPKLGARQVKKGDEVITVASGFPTTINPIIQNGLVPVFVDCRPGSYNVRAEQIETAVTSRTKVVFLAHTLGNPFDLDTVAAVCKKYNLWLIEDSCDALGALYKGRRAGTVGDIGTFSFYPAHHITMGEGGALCTDDPLLNRIILSFRDWGRDCWCKPGKDNTCKARFKGQHGRLPFGYDHKYTYSHIGYNLKITDFQAAVGLSQLKKLPSFLAVRRKNAEKLYFLLSDLKEALLLPEPEKDSDPSWFGFLISVRPGGPFMKQKLVEHLERAGIGTRQLFAGNILRQPLFTDNEILLRIGADARLRRSTELKEEDYRGLPGTEYIMNNTFWVGTCQLLGEREMEKISSEIHRYIRTCR